MGDFPVQWEIYKVKIKRNLINLSTGNAASLTKLCDFFIAAYI